MFIVYSKTNCPACVALKNKLILKGTLFNEINIDEDIEAKRLLLTKGFRSVPQLWDSEVEKFIDV